MKCSHANRVLASFRSRPGDGETRTGFYWCCKDCGLVHMNPEDLVYIMHYYPDRFVQVRQRLMTAADKETVDISRYWSGQYQIIGESA